MQQFALHFRAFLHVVTSRSQFSVDFQLWDVVLESAFNYIYIYIKKLIIYSLKLYKMAIIKVTKLTYFFL